MDAETIETGTTVLIIIASFLGSICGFLVAVFLNILNKRSGS